MAVTNNLGITLLSTAQANKEGTINTGTDVLDKAVAGHTQYDMASDADYTLDTGTDEHVNVFVEITDTGVVLTATRNIIVSSNNQARIVYNNTAQSLVFKTAAGTGITVVAGNIEHLYCDGLDMFRVSDVASFGFPHDLHHFFPGLPATSATLGMTVFPRTVNYASGLTGSVAKAEVAATASTTFNISKNGSNVGSFNFAAAATTATFTMASATTFNSGDWLKIVAPGTQDATLSGIAVTLKGTR